jgi:hypothetical protein
MARGKQLGQIVTLVREESGITTNAAFGQAIADSTRTKIRTHYQRLHADWNWPHLKITRDEPIVAGSRHYTLNADLDPDRLLEVWARETGYTQWRPVGYGISQEHYNVYDPEANSRADPILNWDFFEGGQFEIWPLPLTGGEVRFVGISKAKPLTQDNEIVDLDDRLIALFASAEILAKQKSEDAKLKLDQANVLYSRLKGNGQRSGTFPIQRKSRAWPGVHVRAPGT